MAAAAAAFAFRTARDAASVPSLRRRSDGTTPASNNAGPRRIELMAHRVTMVTDTVAEVATTDGLCTSVIPDNASSCKR
ncbi:MAG: hypothetical protein FWD62_08130 [Betaproteobacteria bacterium]|nr:hypothetical protein [Betaproteobacteria bacterium]